MKIRYEAISDVGRLRTRNEDMAYAGGTTIRDDSDSFEFDVPEEGMKFGAIVCDGLGGHADGDVASELACSLFERFVDNLPAGLDANDVITRVKRWAQVANETIIRQADGNGMATTLTGILLYYNQAYLLNCGDSRVYRLRHNNFKQLTTDHSERVRRSDPTIPANIMYNCLGMEGSFIDVVPTRIVEGDRFLICSDGLSDYVPEDSIRTDCYSAAKLLQDALDAGAPDNVTLILINFE